MGFCAASLSLAFAAAPAFADEALGAAGAEAQVQPAVLVEFESGAEAEASEGVLGMYIDPTIVVALLPQEVIPLRLNNAPEGVVEWSTTDNKVATVDDKGTVTTTGPGKCTIHARVGDVEAKCEVSCYALVRDEKGLTYITPEGVPYTGDVDIHGIVYYFGKDGYALTGWHDFGDGMAYFDPETCVMQFGWQKIAWKDGGKDARAWHHFDEAKGRLLSGWQKNPEGAWMYFDEKKPTEIYVGWEKLAWKGSTYWYLFDKASGHMLTGWQKDDGDWFLLADSGRMLTGWQKDKGSWYHLRDSGRMDTGWIKDKGSWYFLSDSGKMQTGWQKDKGSWYYLSDSGKMQTGWVEDDGSWYYLSDSGRMQTGWLKLKGTWYYLADSGRMLTGTHAINGVTQSFASNGAWLG